MARPKQTDAIRSANGRIAGYGPTPETIAKHHARARLLHIPTGKDPGYAESTIGVLEARGLIEADVARSLIGMRETFERLFGKGHPAGTSIERTFGSGTSHGEPQETEALRRRWTEYKLAISGLTPRSVRDEFENVIIRNRFRAWMQMPRLVWEDGMQPDYASLLASILHVTGQRRGPISDQMANALGLGKTLDELYAR